MLPIVFVAFLLLLLLLLIAGIMFIVVRKKQCTCIGKECNDTDGCDNPCCDALQMQKCVNNVCCSYDCTGKTCSDVNGCGESCSQYVCGTNQKCHEGNCCTPQCSNNDCSDDGCGGTCPCPSGQICYQGSCCASEDCSTGICGGTGTCGNVPCECNDLYCAPESCCVSGNCSYEDICESSSIIVQDYLKKQWGNFCQPLDNGQPSCKNCSLLLPTFQGKSIAPISGTLQCESCSENAEGTEWGPQTTITIDPKVCYYTNMNGVLTEGSRQIGCYQPILCITNDDCSRFGSDGICQNGTCQNG